MISDEERCDVAENLRNLTICHFIQYKEQFFDELAEVVLGFEDVHDFNVVLEKLADLIDPEGPTVASDERDTRIPYRLGTDSYCKFKGRDEYVHMGDFVAIDGNKVLGECGYFGKLSGVEYNDEGYLVFVKLNYPHDVRGYYVAFDGVFHYAKEVTDN